MYNICVFGGTTEGRELVEFLSAQPCNVTACVVTDYAQSLLPASGHVTVSAKKLPAGEIAAMLLSQRFDLVVDATHPYAQSITKSIARACRETGTQYVRLLRKPSAVSPDALYFETTEEAISFLRRTSGRILLTTGSKELSQYAAIEDFSNRVWARVLPLASSLDACQKAGLPPAHIFAMQGPFFMEMNRAIIRQFGIQCLVTKESGRTGGFLEKIRAAEAEQITVCVIGNPERGTKGDSFEEVCRKLSILTGVKIKNRIALVGIGMGQEGTLTTEAAEQIRKADHLFGAERLLASVTNDHAVRYPYYLAKDILPELERLSGSGAEVVILFSGDTGFYSGCARLYEKLK